MSAPLQEVGLAYEWIYNTLTGDSTLMGLVSGVWRSMAPPDTATPFVIMSYQSGLDITTMNAYRIMDDLLIQAKAVGPSNITSSIFSAGSRIDVLLNQVSGTVTGGAVLECHRESPIYLDELVNGELWTNIGGLYRIQIEQA